MNELWNVKEEVLPNGYLFRTHTPKVCPITNLPSHLSKQRVRFSAMTEISQEEKEELMKYSKLNIPGYKDKFGKKITIEELEPLLRDNDYRVVNQEALGPYFVSTVWLGVPHGIYTDGTADYYETMVFLTPKNSNNPREHLGKSLECYRYQTLEEAEKGHKEVVDDPRWSEDYNELAEE